MTARSEHETTPGSGDPGRTRDIRTRDWAWGLVVVVGGTVVGVAGGIWFLANVVVGCGCTYPAPGY